MGADSLETDNRSPGLGTEWFEANDSKLGSKMI